MGRDGNLFELRRRPAITLTDDPRKTRELANAPHDLPHHDPLQLPHIETSGRKYGKHPSTIEMLRRGIAVEAKYQPHRVTDFADNPQPGLPCRHERPNHDLDGVAPHLGAGDAPGTGGRR